MILNAVADGVFTVDPEGRITSFNAAAERITGWKESEVLSKICSVVFFSSPSVNSCALGVSMREKRTIVDYETFIIGKDGFSIPVSVSAAPFLPTTATRLSAEWKPSGTIPSGCRTN